MSKRGAIGHYPSRDHKTRRRYLLDKYIVLYLNDTHQDRTVYRHIRIVVPNDLTDIGMEAGDCLRAMF